MAKPVSGQTTFGANTTGTTTQLDNNFLLAYNALNDLNTYSNYLTDTGSAGTIAVALAAGLTGALTDGLQVQVKIAATNAGATTLAYNGGGALNVKTNDGNALNAGAVVVGGIYLFQYRASDTSWLLLNPFTATVSVAARNRLINAAFINDQRGNGNTRVVADDSYSVDRWNILTQNTNCNVGLQTVQANGIPQNVRLTQTGAVAARLGIEQIVEARDCRDMRGANAVLSGQVRLSVAGNVRYALIEHTGTADTVVSDYVNNWDSAAYSTGNFFISANTTVTAVGVTALSANTWSSITPVSGNVSANMVNLTAFFWTEANANQNVTLDIGTAKLENGAAPTSFIPEEFETDLGRCFRFYEAIGGQLVGSNLSAAIVVGGTGVYIDWTFKTRKRVAPTIAGTNSGNVSITVDFAITSTDGQTGQPTWSSNSTASAEL